MKNPYQFVIVILMLVILSFDKYRSSWEKYRYYKGYYKNHIEIHEVEQSYIAVGEVKPQSHINAINYYRYTEE